VSHFLDEWKREEAYSVDREELSWRERGRLWLRLGIRLVLTILVLLALRVLLPPLFSLLTPFLLALVLAWLLNPAIRSLQRRCGASRRVLSLVLLVLLFAIAGGALAALLYNMVSEAAALVSNWEWIWEGFLRAVGTVEAFLAELFERLPDQVGATAGDLLERLVAWLQETVPGLLTSLGGAAGSFAFSLPSFVVSLVIFIMASYFISSDYPRLRLLFTERLPQEVHTFLGDVKRTAVAAFGGYVKAQLILSAAIFFILLLGFLLIRQPYAVLLALLLAVLDFIPIVGAGTVMVPWAVVDLLTRDWRHAIGLMAIWAVVALFRRGAEPKVVGDQTGLSPILSLLSIYVGMQLGGVVGMILGPVVCLVAVNIGRMGVFSGVMADLRLAARDISALLKNRPAP